MWNREADTSYITLSGLSYMRSRSLYKLRARSRDDDPTRTRRAAQIGAIPALMRSPSQNGLAGKYDRMERVLPNQIIAEEFQYRPVSGEALADQRDFLGSEARYGHDKVNNRVRYIEMHLEPAFDPIELSKCEDCPSPYSS